MIIIDYNQIAISNIMAQIGNHTNVKLEEDLVRHMILNKIRGVRQMFKEHQTVVIACDGKNNWRKNIFPNYKANRKKDREASDFDWAGVFDLLNKIRDELKENFPYIVIHLDHAEADDIIASLVSKYGVELNNNTAEDIVIVSGDKDFVQLQQYANVKQYDPIKNKMIAHSDPSKFIKEQIIKGDRGDGVPNILSSDDCFVSGVRQRKVTSKLISNLMENGIDDQPEDIKRGYMRNQQLIDLSFVPNDIVSKAIAVFEQEKDGCNIKRSKMFNYFINKKLKNLMECVGEF
jgi:hypothetical protein